MQTLATLFFDDWDNLERVLIATPVLYIAVIAFVRLTGKRSTSQMNNFDWIVTVAIGSIIASPVLLKDVSISEGLLAIGLLFGLQWVLTSLIIRSKLVCTVVRASPSVLVLRGEYQRDEMKKSRVTESEIMSAIRENGYASLDDIGLVVLESDAKLSVLPKEAIEGVSGSDFDGLDISANQENSEDPDG
jgi:uncharacterized membrane protein YcaP (DUF421 family)